MIYLNDLWPIIVRKYNDVKYGIKHKIWPPSRIKFTHMSENDYVDKDTLLLHSMFSILSAFIEEECGSNCPIDWIASGHTVSVNGTEVNVRDEMQALYDWWHNRYNKLYEAEEDELFRLMENHAPDHTDKDLGDGTFEWIPVYKNEEDEEKYMNIIGQLNLLYARHENEKVEMMCRLCRVSHYLWT